VADKVQAQNLVRFTRYAKFLGNGLAFIDLSSRAGKVHNSYKAGGDWERDLFIESTSFAVSAYTAITIVNAGLGLIMAASPVGWVCFIVASATVAGTAAGMSYWLNEYIQSNGGKWYDGIMKLFEY
jgi:uncharacterized membrane protein